MPISATVISPNRDEREIVLDQNTATLLTFSAVDAAGDALDLEGHDVQFQTFYDYVDSESVIFTITDLEITGGSEAGTVLVPITTEHTETAHKVNFALRDLTGQIVICSAHRRQPDAS